MSISIKCQVVGALAELPPRNRMETKTSAALLKYSLMIDGANGTAGSHQYVEGQEFAVLLVPRLRVFQALEMVGCTEVVCAKHLLDLRTVFERVISRNVTWADCV